MPLTGIKLEDIDLNHINDLIASRERENLCLEYKLALPDFNIAAQKLEFLHDVSAFANASGGDILYGIKEKRDKKNLSTAIAIAAPGIQVSNRDSLQRHMEGILSSGLHPALRGVQFKWIDLDNGNAVMVLRIPRSWVRPHAVPIDAAYRVSTRMASGKIPLSFKEIGDMIVGSNTLIDKVTHFREERIELLKAGELPIYQQPSAVVLHMVPADSFESGNRFTAQQLELTIRNQNCMPLGGTGFNSRFNFHGLLDMDSADRGKSHAYVQYFRNGVVESANNQMFFKHTDLNKLVFNSDQLEDTIMNAFKQYLDLQRSLGVPLPIFAMISLIGVKGSLICWLGVRHVQDPEPIDLDDLLIPEIIVDNFQVQPHQILKDAFDSIWNAADMPRSLNYDENDNRKTASY